jgi:hypothetical protein
MKKLLAAALLSAIPAFAAEDALLKAMHDELQRSMSLQFDSLDKPYYIEFNVEDAHRVAVSATLDGILSIDDDQFRLPRVHVRVGSPLFDNTNYVGSRGGHNGGVRYPLDDDYAVLRRFFWITADQAYKSAVETISHKRAALKNVSVTEALPDFSPAKQAHLLDDLKPAKLDLNAWIPRVKALAAEFLKYPDLRGPTVEYMAIDGASRMVSSEGGEIRLAESVSEVKFRASAQAKDGMTVRDSYVYDCLGVDNLPPQAELLKAAGDLGAFVTALAAAPHGEDYSGPVLFDGPAAAQLFAELVGRNLALSRKPVTDPGQSGGAATSELAGRLGSRILPEIFSVTDDPTLKEWKGHRLFGTTRVDEEGVEVKPLRIVEKGVLKNFLLTRNPVRGFPSTNGRARLQGSFGNTAAGITNLIVQASETTPYDKLKLQLIDLLKQRERPYGMIVRKMDFPSSAGNSELRRLLSGAARSGGSRPVSIPLRIYRVYADGHEELVRGLRFRALNVRSLKDILAAGDDSNVFNFLENGALFAVMGAGSENAETSVVAPSILVDDLELVRIEDEQPKLPVVPAPLLTSSIQ